MIIWMKLKNKLKKDKDKDKDKKEKFKSIYRISISGNVFMVKESIKENQTRFNRVTVDRGELNIFKKQRYI